MTTLPQADLPGDHGLVPLQSALSPHSQARLKRLCTSIGKKNLAPLAPRSVRFQSALIRRLAENSHPALPQKWEIFQCRGVVQQFSWLERVTRNAAGSSPV